jgi:phosphoribosylaminoimidazolecarboxamide formyltransferase/IMP cyclohydrolase
MDAPSIIQRALISVSDKTHIVDFAKQLQQLGIEIISTGGTAHLLQEQGVPVIKVEDFTGFPEIMNGRVKTLHPKIHGGILGRRDQDFQVMIDHGIDDIDLVVVNLYPFQTTTERHDSTFDEAIEHIDIGGPTLIRAAAKNHIWTAVVVDPHDYPSIIDELQHATGLSATTRQQLATKAFTHTAQYDTAIANYFTQQQSNSTFTAIFTPSFSLENQLRYGENPHQAAALYKEIGSAQQQTLLHSQILQGKALSFNNILDADAALSCIKTFIEPACVIVKHSNPCGVALGHSLKQAYLKALKCDPMSSFGGIIAFNGSVTMALLQVIFEQQFVEVIIAPTFTPEALILAQTKPNVRLLATGTWSTNVGSAQLDFKRIAGGLLVQTADLEAPDLNYTVVTQTQPTPEQWQDLRFSWEVARFVKSNAIVYAANLQTLGIGAGQMSRIFSAEIAHLKAKASELNLQGAVMASDAFFPFEDSIELVAKLGITAIIQPGGAKRDPQIIAQADKHQLAMVFTHCRHFNH